MVDSLEEFSKYNFRPATLYKRIRKSCKCLSTGVFPIDMAISEVDDDGVAGIRERDALELVGPNNSFKTAVSISMIVETQKRFPGNCVVAVFSEPFDPDRLEACGVDLERLMVYIVYDEDSKAVDMLLAEKALDAVLHIIRNEEVRLVVIDSVAALTPKGLEFDGSKEREFGKATVALLAKIMNEFIVKFKNHAAKAVLCMINHYKEKINTDFMMMQMEDKSKLETPGGRGSEFLSDVRILCKSNVILQKEKHSVLDARQGDYVECTWNLFKNKYCPTVIHRTVKGKFDPARSKFNNEEVLIDWGHFFTVKKEEKGKDPVYLSKLSTPIVKAAAWVRIGDSIKINGKEKAALELENHPELVDKLKKEMYKLEGELFQDKKPSLEELLEQ